MSAHDGPTVRVFDNLESSPEFTLRWLPEFAFATAGLGPDELARLHQLAGVEVDFGTHGDHEGFLRDFLTRTSRHKVLFAVESESAPTRPIRSHKGLFYRAPTIRAGVFKEVEIDVGSGYTHLVGMAVITDANVRECATRLGDGLRSFAVIAEHDVPLTRANAERALSAVAGLPGGAYLNYARVAASFCDIGTTVMRMAGYGNDGDAALQSFAIRREASGLVGAFKTIVERAAIT
jgi:hypothetical protein